MSTKGTNGANGNGNGKSNKHLNYWSTDPRWSGITRPYSYSDVLRLRGSIQIEYTLARLGAERLWNLMHTDAYVPALGAITGNQAIELVQAGRQSRCAHAGVHRETGGGATGCRRLRRADDSDRADRCQLRRSPTFRRRRARPGIHLRRTHAGRFLRISWGH